MSAGTSRRPALLWIGVFAGAALISGFTILRGLDPFDEGLALQAARRVSEGQLPYADFLWAYGPGAPYLLGGLRELFGDSLLVWRIVRVLADATVATAVFALVRRETGETPLALVAWLLAACALADPRSANPDGFALPFVMVAFVLAPARPPRPLPAGILLGLAAAFRIDFALFGLAAVLVALALRRGEGRSRALLRCGGAFLGVGLIAYAPFLVAVGPADLYDALIGTSLRESRFWTLPFPFDYDGSLGDLESLLEFYVPLLLLVGAVAAAFTLALRWRNDRRAPWVGAGLVVLAVGFALYLRSRPDAFHTQPLDVALAALLPVAIVATRVRPLAIGLAAVLALLALDASGDRLKALVDPPSLSTVDVPAADGVKAPPAEARAVERTVALVDSLVPPDEPIYVLPRRSDLVVLGAPLVYVLAGRDNPTPRDHGLLSGAGAQSEIVADLQRSRPRALVRWTDPLSSRPEPNDRGVPSGVTTVDDWVAAHYRLAQRAGYYDVLVPKG